MSRYIILLCIWLSLFTSSSYATTFNSDKLSELSQERHWQILLHFRDGESEIDDKKFFFSQEGKFDLHAELSATIDAFIIDKSNDENSSMCRFPARAKWILEVLPELENQIKKPDCTALNAYVASMSANYITLVFPTAHINSPASMFGHTLLRIDSSIDTPLIANSVSYAAATKETNGFLFAYRGIFGEYEGRYQIAPYYKKIDEYSSMEQRDIWEYRLNLTKEEIEDIVLHVYEISDVYSDYWFFTENCSYNILWLLELARNELSLVDKFDMKVTPIDTIREVSKSNLIAHEHFRASKTRKMRALLQLVKDKAGVMDFLESDRVDAKEGSDQEKRALLELATEYLRYQHSENKIETASYSKKLLGYLRNRSKLGKMDAYTISKSDDPLLGHESSRVSFGVNEKLETLLSVKGTYHDKTDIEQGYIPGAYINFLDLKVNIDKERVRLENFSLLKIESYAKRDALFKPLSWKIQIGASPFKNGKNHLNVTGGFGLSYGSDSYYYYMMIQPSIYYYKTPIVGIGLNGGYLYHGSKKIKVGLESSHEKFSDGLERSEIKSYVSYGFSKRFALNVMAKKSVYEQKEESLEVKGYYYF
jgi:hypothetical protein